MGALQRDLVTVLGLAEPLSAFVHLLTGVALAFFALALVRRGRTPGERASLAAYAVTVVGMFLTSAIYHSLPWQHPARVLFWHLDHASIWLVLAATFTAVRFVMCEGRFVPVLGVLWTIAGAGVVVEMAALPTLDPWVSPLLYIFMGWCGLPTVLLAWRLRGAEHGAPLLLGGIVVTIGGFMDAFQWPHLLPRVFEAHELLHLTTVVGGFAYFRGLWRGAATAPTPAALAPLAQALDAARA